MGLVRHAASIERSWFRFALNAEDVRSPWPGEVDGTSAEFHVEDADVDEAFGVRHEECVRARAVASSFASLDDTVNCGGVTISLRYVLTHMIEEYARHNGHADLEEADEAASAENVEFSESAFSVEWSTHFAASTPIAASSVASRSTSATTPGASPSATYSSLGLYSQVQSVTAPPGRCLVHRA
ncbi:mycothiol transferase [Streptomyces rugosispiralis]|uniref:mycothiol transferase n=1 Tax=Streptomyces rugosispiralis TaxID=2967341 RepID=UPI0037037D48